MANILESLPTFAQYTHGRQKMIGQDDQGNLLHGRHDDIVVETKEIICSAHDKGREHDFALFKCSELKVDELTEVSADKGYQGIKALHEYSFIPIKKKKGQKLSKPERDYNRDLGRMRICVEHVNARLKRFRILGGPYRYRFRGFGRRFNLIAAISNLLIFPYLIPARGLLLFWGMAMFMRN